MGTKHLYFPFLLVLLFIFLSGCVGKEHQPENQSTTVSQVPISDSISDPVSKSTNIKVDGDYEIKVFKNESPLSGFGYDVLHQGKIYIHQPNIPAIQGNQGFKNTEDAEKTARLVLHKIKNNILPPSIDVKELDSLKVLIH